MPPSLQILQQILCQHQATLEHLQDPDIYKIEKPYILGYDIALDDETKRSNLEFEF
jgi:hypothetical protein